MLNVTPGTKGAAAKNRDPNQAFVSTFSAPKHACVYSAAKYKARRRYREHCAGDLQRRIILRVTAIAILGILLAS